MKKLVKTKVECVVLTFFTAFASGSSLRNRKPAKHLSREMHGGVAIATAKVLADVALGHSSDFPSAIEMFEALPGKSGFGLIAENQVSLGQRRVPAEVPGLANLEVAEQVRRYVRSERNRHQRIEKFFGLFEVRIDSRQIEKSELGKLPEEREVGFEMVHEFREVCLCPWT